MKRNLLVVLMSVSSLLSAASTPKILLEKDPTLLTSSVQVVVRVGSEMDPHGKTGVTNFLAELLLRGTKHKTRSQFQSELERMGASINASAAHDMIIISGHVIREKTPEFLRLLEDAIVHPAFSAKEFKALKTEILADINDIKNNNMRLSGLTLRHELFAGTPLERPVAGSLGTVHNITLKDITHAYDERFRKGNFVFAAAVPVDETMIEGSFQRIWKAFPDGSTPRPASIAPKVPAKPTLVLVQKPHTSTGAMLMGQAGITAQEKDRYSLMVGNFAFGAEPLVARLFRVVRSQLGWTYSIGSTYFATGGLSYQQGLYVMSATPSIEFTVKSIVKMLSLWHDYMEGGLKGDELKLAQESLVNSYPFEFDSPEKRLWQRLYSYLYDVPVLTPEEYAKTINGVSNKKLIAALNAHQSATGWLIALVADRKVIEKQLAEEQKDLPKDKRISISKELTPAEAIQ